MIRSELDAAGIDDPHLRDGYRRCRELNAAHGRTFFLATRLLAPDQRPAVHALYGFARYADDILDDLDPELGTDIRAERLQLLADRFFAGGDRSVRGYAYQSLGPTNDLGEVIGGKHLLVGSAELEKRFLKNWGAAVFYDIGNAFNNLGNYDLAQGAGIGLRYFTPVGPARLDVARAFGADRDGYRLHIGLGVGW